MADGNVDTAPDTAPAADAEADIGDTLDADTEPDTSPDATDPCAGGCEDGDPCTDDACGAGVGCLHTPNTGKSCNDGNACTDTDVCQAGTCTGVALDCSDNSACTSDSCDPIVSCVHAPIEVTETCNGQDDDCDGETDEADAGGCTLYYADADGDGYGKGSGFCLCAADAASLITAQKAGDCLDSNAAVHPSLVKDTCATAGLDDNCDGVTDAENATACLQFFFDGDGDGYGVLGQKKCLCAAASPYAVKGVTAASADCDDGQAGVHPTAAEACDGVDQNCDGQTDEGAASACEDANACTSDGCGAGGCTHLAVGDGAACSDGLSCTTEACQAGACAATALPCQANAACVEATGCTCKAQYLGIDVDGVTVCAPDFPVWGPRPDSPAPSAFTQNGDGTITDAQTQRLWQEGASGSGLSWVQAKAYCQSLTLANQGDWRLPTMAELSTLLDFAKNMPAAAAAFAPTTTNDAYWTAGTLKWTTTTGWALLFSNGAAYAYDATKTGRARCVRTLGDATPPAPRFVVDAAAGTVDDTLAKVTWQRDGLTSGLLKWPAAWPYCTGLDLDGKGWRLPTVTELMGLVDRSQLTPAIDATAFPGTPSDYYWTNHYAAWSSGIAWAVLFDNGQTATRDTLYTTTSRVRCVRDAGCAGKDCADENPCSEDYCEAGVCQHIANSASSEDGNACTLGDACKVQICIPGAVTKCDDGDACSIDSCVAASGCEHVAKDCEDNNVCTSDACDKKTGCQHVPVSAGTDCGNGKSCDALGICGGIATALIPGGTFWMGCNTAKDAGCQSTYEVPQHKVTLTTYQMDATEVTVGAYKVCVDAGVCPAPGTGTGATWPNDLDKPVNYIEWGQARWFCKWRGAGYDLPTEAQWEMAARGDCGKNGSSASDASCKSLMRVYPWGDAAPDCTLAVLSNGGLGCGTSGVWAVGSKPLGDSPYGLHDMAGNVMEWTLDGYNVYPDAQQVDPLILGSMNVISRGGTYQENAAGQRASRRTWGTLPNSKYVYEGFRCARAATCSTDGDCDDANPCSSDVCQVGVCIHGAGTAACEDGDACTTGDTCSAKLCSSGAPTNCDDGNVCTSDFCDSGVGCQHSNADGACGTASCDGNAYMSGGVCDAGSCEMMLTDCNDGNACTTDSCDASVGCLHANTADWTPCGTGQVCNGSGTCQDSATGKGMAFIPTATFWMGCNASKDASCSTLTSENPQHEVTLSGYYMDLTETTVAQYKVCVDAGGCTVPGSLQPTPYATYPDAVSHPVNFVTWAQMRQYCQWRGNRFDLPTEAQWEMAARGSCAHNGSADGNPLCSQAMRTFPWGELTTACSYAVQADGGSKGCGTNATWPVASKMAGDSPYGLHDMAGNVWEWNRDWYGAYAADPQTDPAGPASAAARVLRGGAFNSASTDLRGGYRLSVFAAYTSGDLGGRCVRGYTCSTAAECDDANANTGDTCDLTAGCIHTPIEPCGNGVCDGEETVASCAADCAFLIAHTAGSCTTPGAWDSCPDGYICVARAVAAGGNLCVADFDTWPVLPETRALADYSEDTELATDLKTGLSWAKESIANKTWASALTACTAKTYGGLADWRLPTAAELDTVSDFAHYGPASVVPGLVWPTDPWYYWSDVPFPGGGNAWTVICSNGTAYAEAGSYAYRVRCVRSPAGAAPAGSGMRFVAVDAGAAILDRVTGLRWSASLPPDLYAWADAKTYCANNTAALPGTGWRLPTVRELRSIVTRKESNPLFVTVWSGEASWLAWSATPSYGGGSAWQVNAVTGVNTPLTVSSGRKLLCVR